MLMAIGLLVGLTVGIIISLGTAHISNKALFYFVNIAIALLARLVSQWVLVLVGRPIMTRIGSALIQKTLGRRAAVAFRIPLGEFDRGFRIELVAGLTVTLATILSTEPIDPKWLTQPVHIIWMSGVLGLIVGVIESLSLPTNIYVLKYGKIEQ